MSTVIAGAATDVGRVREHNEDSHLLDPNSQIFIVADGMGVTPLARSPARWRYRSRAAPGPRRR